jgi:hypothetical protein
MGMRPIGAENIIVLLKNERALSVARGLSIPGSTREEVAAEAGRRRIDPRLIAAALTIEELHSLCAHRGLVPGPSCSREDIIELALGDGPAPCEVAYLPWWGDPHAS